MYYSLAFLCVISLSVGHTSSQNAEALEQKIHALEKELQHIRHQRQKKRPLSYQKNASEAPSMDQNVAELPEPVRSQEYDLYEKGRHYLAQQRLDLSLGVFEEIIDNYKGTPEAILAHFWIGDLKLQDQNYAGASLALGQAYGDLKKRRRQKDFSTAVFHGEESRLPEILAKLAYALQRLNKRQDACITLRQLRKDYPEQSATLLWYTQKLSKELKCR